MFARFHQSWALAQDSWRVVRADKEILLFPLVGGIGALLVGALFALPLALSNLPEAIQRGQSGAIAAALVVLWAFLFCQTVVVLFAQSAVVAAALIRLRGGDPTVGDGMRAAGSRLHAIFAFAAIAATVGLILQVIDALASSARGEGERDGNIGEIVLGIVGSIAASLLGAAWSIATFFVVPVMVVEGIGPVEAIRRSTRLIRDFWGESAILDVGLGLVFFLVYLVLGVVGVGLAIAAFSAKLAAIGIVLVVVTVVAICLAALVQSALRGVFVAALYRYAVEGETSPAYFEEAVLRRAFVPRMAAA
jgi:uncharacterized membrane protein YeaQ/YmgE (transglycosylase-associated protein family)